MNFYLWCTVFWIAIASTINIEPGHVTILASHRSLCRKLPKGCHCFRSAAIKIQCNKLTEVEQISSVLKTYFTNHSINLLQIENSTLPEIEAYAFDGLRITRLTFGKAVIGNVCKEALEEVIGLQELNWEFVPGFDTVPSAVSGNNLNVFRFTYSDLISVGTELQNMTKLQILNLSFNKIKMINPEAFLNCSSMKTILLNNNRIQELDENIFQNVRNIQEINLDNNQLVTIKSVLEPSALVLQKVSIINNSLENISSVINFRTTNLNKIYLSHNPLKILRRDDFDGKFVKIGDLWLANTSLCEIEYGALSGIQEIERLYLMNNSLTDLPRNWLPGSLQELHLENNLLTNVSGPFHSIKKNFQVLTLDGNRLKNLENFSLAMPTLQELTLSNNGFESVPINSFVNFPSLIFLSLSSNNIKDINNKSFYGSHTVLDHLDLSFNLIENLEGAFGVETTKNLKVLNLNNNRIRKLSRSDFVLMYLRKLDLSYNALSSLNETFSNLKNLKYLNLQHNQLITITRQNFPPVIPLNQIQLAGNPLSCDCRLMWLVEMIQTDINRHMGIDRTSVCLTPKWLNGTYLYKLTTNTITLWKDDCPNECNSCKCYSVDDEITVSVNCSSCNLTSAPSVYPPETVSLNLSDNKLNKVPDDLKQCVPNLVTLDLSGNDIDSHNDIHLPSSLKTLNISDNQFRVFPEQALSSMNLTSVDVSYNPWTCDCNSDSFRTWLLRNSRMIRHVNETRCSNSISNGLLAGKQIASLTQIDLCPVKVALYAIIAIGILAFFLSGAGTFIGYIRYQMPIKVWLYSKGFCLSWVKEEDLNEDKEYDAFVAFSSEEQHCVDEILAELETKPPHFKLCVHYRDFIGGELILENIARAVTSSKKTLILLSRSFLESEWTMQEFRQAHHQTMEEKINRIILVLVGELPPDEDINEDVRAYLRTATYLQWEDKCLWQKLRHAMPRNSVPREESNSEPSTGTDNDESPLIRVPHFD